MVPVTALLLPILISAAIVFIASSIIHMVLKYHESDFGKVPSEDDVMDALRPFSIPPGDYVIPCGGSMEALKDPEYIARTEKGPVAIVTVLPNGKQGMGGSLLLWFFYCILVSIFAAYLTGRALEPGAHYLTVFRFAGTVAFAGHGLALLQNSVWLKRAWSSTIKSIFDALIYALLTAGTFGWLWPE